MLDARADHLRREQASVGVLRPSLIETAQDFCDGIAAEFDGLGVDPRLRNPLLSKFQSACNSMGRNKLNSARGQLGAFLNQVSAQTAPAAPPPNGKKLTPEQGSRLEQIGNTLLGLL